MSGASRPRIVVLISGAGSNLQALIDAGPALGGEIVAVVSNRSAAFGLIRARGAGIPTQVALLGPYRDAGLPRERYDAELADRVEALKPDLIVLAGWMHVLSPAFLDRFPGRVMNLHPALPGAYPGTRAIERALVDAKAGLIDHTGVMVHIVVPEIDAGPVLLTERVPVLPEDDLDALAGRMHAVEHRVLVGAVQRWCADRA